MTPNNITNSPKSCNFSDFALYDIAEYQAFGSRPLRKELQIL